MALLNTSQYFDYPIYLVEFVVTDGGDTRTYGFWIMSANAVIATGDSFVVPPTNEPNTYNTIGATLDLALSLPLDVDFFSAVKSWVNSVYITGGKTLTDFRVTEFTESGANISVP